MVEVSPNILGDCPMAKKKKKSKDFSENSVYDA